MAMSTTTIHDNGHFCAGNHSFDRTEFGLKVKVGATSCGRLFTAPGVSAASFFRERVSPLWETPLGVIPQTRTEEVNVQVCARETFTSPTIGGKIRRAIAFFPGRTEAFSVRPQGTDPSAGDDPNAPQAVPRDKSWSRSADKPPRDKSHH